MISVVTTIIEFETYFTKELPVQINRACINSVKEIGNEVKKEAIRAYREKRKKGGGPSLIIDSFGFEIPSISNSEYRGVVFCGGPDSQAYYAQWVDEGHTLRNGNWWDGYEFMWAGYIVGDNKATDIVINNLSKFDI